MEDALRHCWAVKGRNFDIGCMDVCVWFLYRTLALTLARCRTRSCTKIGLWKCLSRPWYTRIGSGACLGRISLNDSCPWTFLPGVIMQITARVGACVLCSVFCVLVCVLVCVYVYAYVWVWVLVLVWVWLWVRLWVRVWVWVRVRERE